MDSSKFNRNDPCPCGSGKKYKKCCMNKQPGEETPVANMYFEKYGIRLKNAGDVAAIRKSGKLVVDTLRMVEAKLVPGMTTNNINELVHEYTISHGATPAPLNYRGFPKSVCTSVNNVICHGIPDETILKDGDIVNVDVTSILDGYFADANMTFFVGKPLPEGKKIVNIAKTSLKEGIKMVKPGNTLGDIGYAIQKYAEGLGCSVVREYIGHGVGFKFHEPPDVAHYGRKGEGIKLIPGMVFTIEPMINLGTRFLKVLADGWTVVTVDGNLSAQFEQTILVTETGYESLTPYPL